MKQRLKSYKFWVSLSASVILFVNALGNLFGFRIDEVAMESVIMAFCGVLVVLGFVDKPKENQSEEKPNEEKADLPEEKK
ncbi:MAG: hypothetical protein IKV69_02510 [Clostridia bacterium]|nr:hypothetical protein [Clostridia bacterium]